MGDSTDAILFWGFTVDEEELEDDEYPFDGWQEKYAALKGVLEPVEEFSEKTKEVHHQYWEKKDAALEEAGVEIDMHCCGQEPMPFVTVTASKIVTSRGSVSEIKSLDVDPSWEPKLRAFCEMMKISWKEPGWRQVSWWG